MSKPKDNQPFRWTKHRYSEFKRLRGTESLEYIAALLGAPLRVITRMDHYVAANGDPELFRPNNEKGAARSFSNLDEEWRDQDVSVPEGDPLLARLIRHHGKRPEYVEFQTRR